MHFAILICILLVIFLLGSWPEHFAVLFPNEKEIPSPLDDLFAEWKLFFNKILINKPITLEFGFDENSVIKSVTDVLSKTSYNNSNSIPVFDGNKRINTINPESRYFSLLEKGSITLTKTSCSLDIFLSEKTSNYICHVIISGDINELFFIPRKIVLKGTNTHFKYLPENAVDNIAEFTKDGVSDSQFLEVGAETSGDSFCFGSVNIGAESLEECSAYKGTWDSPVRDSKLCPFYLANKNYSNTRGGVNVGGYCDLPSGTQALGFRFISSEPQYEPLCYNCNTKLIGQGSLGHCCQDQSDKSLYPLLNGPDYKFPGDSNDRKKQNLQII